MVMIFKAVKTCVQKVDVKIQPEFPSTGRDGNHHLTGKLVRSESLPTHASTRVERRYEEAENLLLKNVPISSETARVCGRDLGSASMSVASSTPRVCLLPPSCTFGAMLMREVPIRKERGAEPH